MKRFKALLALFWMLPLADCGTSAAQGSPDGVPGALSAALSQARRDWTPEAQLVQAIYTRARPGERFGSDLVFLAASRQKLYHIRTTPLQSGNSEGDYRFLPVLTSRIIDLPQALASARRAGMKGNLMSARLMLWLPHNRSVAVEVWRLVPDNDPNLEDPNDPNMKNYFVDAVTGTLYAAVDPDEHALRQGREAMNRALTTEMTEYMKSLQHRRGAP